MEALSLDLAFNGVFLRDRTGAFTSSVKKQIKWIPLFGNFHTKTGRRNVWVPSDDCNVMEAMLDQKIYCKGYYFNMCTGLQKGIAKIKIIELWIRNMQFKRFVNFILEKVLIEFHCKRYSQTTSILCINFHHFASIIQKVQSRN